MRHTKKMTQFTTHIVAKNKKKKTMSRDLEDFDEVVIFSKTFNEQLAIAYDLFWQNKQLGYDKDGRLIRTDIKRIRPRDYRDQLFGVLKKKAEVEQRLNKKEIK